MLRKCYKINNSVTYIACRGTSSAEVPRQARVGRQGGHARAYACAYASWKLAAASKLEREAGTEQHVDAQPL